MTSLDEAWEDLSRRRPAGEGWLTRRLHPDEPMAFFAGVDGASGQPAVLFDIATASLPPSQEVPRSRGFTVEIVPRSPGPNGRVWLALGLLDRSRRALFGVMAADVVGAALVAGSERLAVQVFLSRLREWQSFMERQLEGGLSREAQTGLFAELLFLEEVALAHFPPLDALAAWQGPEGGLQDWRRGNVAVEIKATCSLEPATFSVSRLGQLDENGLECLLILHQVLEESGTGRSLPRLVEDIGSSHLKGHDTARALFAHRLLHAGYHAALSDRYEGRRLRPATRQYFLVHQGFPRFRRDEVPAGIVDCAYSVALPACRPFAIEHASFVRRLQGLFP